MTGRRLHGAVVPGRYKLWIVAKRIRGILRGDPGSGMVAGEFMIRGYTKTPESYAGTTAHSLDNGRAILAFRK